MSDVLTIDTAGFSANDKLMFDPRRTRCGDITDGVSFQHGDRRGWWVMSYDDLMLIADAATKARQ